MYASIRKLEDVRVCMQQVSSMTNELKVSRWLHMYMQVCTNTHTSKGNLFDKKITYGRCGLWGNWHRQENLKYCTCEVKDEEYLLSQSQLCLPNARPGHE